MKIRRVLPVAFNLHHESNFSAGTPLIAAMFKMPMAEETSTHVALLGMEN